MERRILEEAGFPPIDFEGWRKLAEKTLKGGDFTSLISHTDDGIEIEPLHARSTNAKALFSRPQGRWLSLQRTDDPDPERARQQIAEDVDGGANGISFVFEGAPNAAGYGLPAEPEIFARLLDGIPIDALHLRIDPHPGSRASADWLAEYLVRRRADASRLSLSLGIDPATTLAATGRLRMTVEALRASLPQSLAGFFAHGLPGVILEADGRAYHNGGASEAQELGAVLSAAVGHLRLFEDARQPLVYAVGHIGFALAVDQDQFVSIAKLRALRKLWARVQEACGTEPAETIIHAETSWRMMTALDPETNILRATIAAFAAAVGGADSVSVLPHTLPLGLPDASARRLARNMQLILADESHVGAVADPGAGSGGIEALTERLCEAGWEEFRQLEAEGGVMQSLVDGRLQRRIATARKARLARVADGRRKIIGTTLYPLKEERPAHFLDARRGQVREDGAVLCEPLPRLRIDEGIAAPVDLEGRHRQ